MLDTQTEGCPSAETTSKKTQVSAGNLHFCILLAPSTEGWSPVSEGHRLDKGGGKKQEGELEGEGPRDRGPVILR